MMFLVPVTEANGCVKRNLAQVSDSFGLKLINEALESS